MYEKSSMEIENFRSTTAHHLCRTQNFTHSLENLRRTRNPRQFLKPKKVSLKIFAQSENLWKLLIKIQGLITTGRVGHFSSWREGASGGRACTRTLSRPNIFWHFLTLGFPFFFSPSWKDPGIKTRPKMLHIAKRSEIMFRCGGTIFSRHPYPGSDCSRN